MGQMAAYQDGQADRRTVRDGQTRTPTDKDREIGRDRRADKGGERERERERETETHTHRERE